jgi:tetratricopeptide (TPR) repeat protein
MTMRTPVLVFLFTASAVATALADAPAAPAPAAAAAPAAAGGRKRREPPPAVIPTAEVEAAERLYRSQNYSGAVDKAKTALNRNERYTPAMLVMAKAYFKLGKNEWVKTLGDMMKNAGASEAERAEIYQMLAFMEVDKQNTPGAIEMLKKATEARPDNALLWNNLGAQYLVAKNYREAVPVLEKSTQIQPSFAKAHLNLGSAYRGVREYEKALAEYQQALQLFPRYADAVFNLGILYLDADKMPNQDLVAKLNAAISYLQQYKQMVVSVGQTVAPEADAYISEAQEGIKKEQKRVERQKKQAERDQQRAAKKAADDAKKAAGPAPGAGVPAGAARSHQPAQRRPQPRRGLLPRRHPLCRRPAMRHRLLLRRRLRPPRPQGGRHEAKTSRDHALGRVGSARRLDARGCGQERARQDGCCATGGRWRSSERQGRTGGGRQEGLQDSGRDRHRGQDPEAGGFLRTAEVGHKL